MAHFEPKFKNVGAQHLPKPLSQWKGRPMPPPNPHLSAASTALLLGRLTCRPKIIDDVRFVLTRCLDVLSM